MLHEHFTGRDAYMRSFTFAPRRVVELAEMLCHQDDHHASVGAFSDVLERRIHIPSLDKVLRHACDNDVASNGVEIPYRGPIARD